MRILNVTIDENKNILIALTKIYGIGLKRSKKILNLLNIENSVTISLLSDEKREELKNLILNKENTFGNFLKRSINNNIKKEITLKTYKGSRYKNKMPVRGQRTRTNSRTAKKKNNILLDIS